MIPNKPKYIPYSYRSFMDDNLSFKIIKYNELLEKDTIDLTNKSTSEIHDIIFRTFDDYSYDINAECSHYKLYHLKEFVVKEYLSKDYEEGYQYNIYDYLDSDRYIRYWSYDISDWDENDRLHGIDSRTLTVGIYEYDNLCDKYKELISYTVKLDHIYQLILDLEKITKWLMNKNNDKIRPNLYVLPIYMHQTRYMGHKVLASLHFVRISDFLAGDDNEYICKNLLYILAGLYRFATLNFKMVLSEEQSIVFDEVDEHPQEIVHHTREKVDESLRPKREYKTDTKYTYLDLGDDISLRVKTNRRNIYYTGKSHSLHAYSDYQVQVAAHYRRYICGTGDNRHYELRRIEPFIRNMKGSAKSVKVYSK